MARASLPVVVTRQGNARATHTLISAGSFRISRESPKPQFPKSYDDLGSALIVKLVSDRRFII